MIAISKKVVSFVLLAGLAAAPLACVNINKQPDDRPKTEVNVGGDRGVNVEHQNDKHDNN